MMKFWQKDRSRRMLLTGFIWFALAVVLFALMIWPTGEQVKWLTWKQDNTYPGRDTFEIKDEERENDYFGTIKAEYALEVYPGQYVCVRVDTVGGNDYNWYVMGYYGQVIDDFSLPRTELKAWASPNMLVYGAPPFYYLRSNTWMCRLIPKIRTNREAVDGPYTVFKVHWCGFGHGGTVAKPIIVVSDHNLEEGE